MVVRCQVHVAAWKHAPDAVRAPQRFTATNAAAQSELQPCHHEKTKFTIWPHTQEVGLQTLSRSASGVSVPCLIRSRWKRTSLVRPSIWRCDRAYAASNAHASARCGAWLHDARIGLRWCCPLHRLTSATTPATPRSTACCSWRSAARAPLWSLRRSRSHTMS